MKGDFFIPKTRGRVAALAVAAALALPMVPGAAFANQVDANATLESAIQSVAEPVQEADGGIDLMAATTAPKYDYEVYYLDGMGDTWYSNYVERYLYIRTDNPEADFLLKMDERVGYTNDRLLSGYFKDVADEGTSNDALRVPGGYIVRYGFDASPGVHTLELYEGSGSDKTLAATFTASFINYDDALNEWIDDTIAKYTTSSMNSLEKIKAVTEGLSKEFRYLLNDGTYKVRLVREPSDPFFISKRWESFIAPMQLTNIAKRIGGFEDVHNCYYDVENWSTRHDCVRVTYKGDTFYFSAYPSTGGQTGEIDVSSIKKIDFSNTSSSTFDVPQGFKQVEAQDDQKTSHKITVDSRFGVTFNGFYDTQKDSAVTGEQVSIHCMFFDTYRLTDIYVTTASGKDVPFSRSGSGGWFIMPDEDITITLKFETNNDLPPIAIVAHRAVSIISTNGALRFGEDFDKDKVEIGDNVAFVIDPDDGYRISDVTVTTKSGESVKVYGADDTRWFTMPSEDVTLTVAYEKAVNKRYIDVVQPAEGGTVSISGSPATVGSVVKVYPKPDDGWKVGSVTYTDVNGKVVDIPQTANITWAFNMPDADVTVKVTFVKDAAYRVKANKPAHATVYLQDRDYAPGEEVYYMIDPDEGYGVSSIKAVDGNGKTVKLTGPVSYPDGLRYTFTMPESDVTITAAVEEDKEVQPIDVEVHDCSVLAPQEAKPGVEVNLHVEPNDGYTLEKGAVVVTDKDGKSVAVTERATGEYWFTMPDGPVTVTATASKGVDDEEPEQIFSDVAPDAWYAEPVAWAVENGIFHGYEGSNNFGPNDSITRAQMATVLYNVAKNPEVDTTIMDCFEDCVAGSWYGEAVSWAVQEGIFSGYSDSGKFSPDDPITREQIAVVLWRQAGEPAAAGDLTSFPDGWKTSTWALEAMTWAVDEGIFTGNSVTGELMPTGNLTRAEAATVMMRLLS